MNRFLKIFSDSNKKVFVPYFTLGDPTPEKSLAMISDVLAAGAEALELGIPFTDPVADGPTNQRAMARALKAGMTFDKSLEIIATLRERFPHVPIGLLVYYNLIFFQGIEKAYQKLADAGVDALVCAELPLEEATDHEKFLKKYDLGCVHMIFPNTTKERAEQCLKRSSAFTYVVARAGTTGASAELATDLTAHLNNLKKLHDSPIIVGFGLSKPEHVKAVWQAGANGAIVASKFANDIENNLDNLDVVTQGIIEFMRKLQ